MNQKPVPADPTKASQRRRTHLRDRGIIRKGFKLLAREQRPQLIRRPIQILRHNFMIIPHAGIAGKVAPGVGFRFH